MLGCIRHSLCINIINFFKCSLQNTAPHSDRNWYTASTCELKQSFVCKANIAEVDPTYYPDDRGDLLDCPADWEVTGNVDAQTGHHCMKAFDTEVSWFEANHKCMVSGGHLVSIHSPEFNQRVIVRHRFIAPKISSAANQGRGKNSREMNYRRDKLVPIPHPVDASKCVFRIAFRAVLLRKAENGRQNLKNYASPWSEII